MAHGLLYLWIPISPAFWVACLMDRSITSFLYGLRSSLMAIKRYGLT